MTSELYKELKSFKKNEISATDIYDPLIKTVRSNGIVVLDLTSEYFNIIFDPNTSNKSYVEAALSYYSYYDYFMFDSWRAQEEWNEGYLLQHFNQENNDLLNKILRMLGHNPESLTENEIPDILSELFHNQVDYIVGEFQSQVDYAHIEVVKEMAYKEFCNVLFNLEIYYVNKNKCFEKYVTTVDNLIHLYENLAKINGESINYDIKKLLTESVIENNLQIDDELYEDVSDGWHMFFDGVDFNRYVKNKLEDMLEKLEEDSENIEGYRRIIQSLKKFNFDHWYQLPKNDKIVFRIKFVSPKTLEITFEVKRKDNKAQIKTYHLGYDRFMLFLYHPELFDVVDY